MQHIPDYRQFVNERVNLKAAHLSSEDYQKAKKLKAFDSADWAWNSKSQLYDKVNESVVTEAKFTRLPKQLNAMWELKNSVENMVGRHDNGDDYDPNQMRTIEEFIKKIKKSAKSFKSKEEVVGTIYESNFSPLGYAKRVVAGAITLKDAMKEAGISLSNMGKLIKKIDKKFDIDAAFLESKVNEGPGKGYYIKVSVRDAKKALAILDDMYRKKFDINGSNVYYFKDEDIAYDAMMDLSAEDIEIADTNIEESLDENADPCWDDYKIGSPKTKISSKSGKRVNNCVPKDESVVNEATDINDPVLMAFRRTRAIMELPKFKSAEVKSRRISFDKYMDLLDSQTDIAQDIKDKAEEMAQTFRDMEQEAEPEGGVMADKYGSIMMNQEKEYTQLKAKKAKIDARVEKYKMN